MDLRGLPNIEEKVFLVTGGAAGIGAGIVRALLSENARHVAFFDVAEREGAALEGELLNKFGALRAKFIKCDIADEAQLATAYKQVLDKYHRLDAVINNAAVLSADERLYGRMIDINFKATVSSTYKALDAMSVNMGGRGGTILNVSSLVALHQTSDVPVYSATKLAVIQFSNSIGTEKNYTRTEVRVITVCLGPTDTAILHRHNLDIFDKDCAKCLSSYTAERQKVESAVNGIIEVVNIGENGTTWVIADDKPPSDVTQHVKEGFGSLFKLGIEKCQM